MRNSVNWGCRKRDQKGYKRSYGSKFDESLRDQIRDRDNRTCQFCKITEKESLGKYGSYGSSLDVHHIDYDKSHNDDSNLISLCKGCHGRTKSEKEFWTVFYQSLMKRKALNAGKPSLEV